eukprot:420119-Rhodomonas_salina.2
MGRRTFGFSAFSIPGQAGCRHRKRKGSEKTRAWALGTSVVLQEMIVTSFWVAMRIKQNSDAAAIMTASLGIHCKQ